MKRRALAALCVLALTEGSLAVIACDATDAVDDAVDATDERSSSSSDAAKDSGPARPDASSEASSCAPVPGACDLVLQNCPDTDDGQKQECVAAGTDGSVQTTCTPVQASQLLPKGRSCCPASDGNAANPCLPGLTCVGRACEDGGPQTGRCTPACCKGDDQACGKSEPEGIAGACDVSLVDGNDHRLYDVCSYRERCKPFGVEPCSAGQMCLVEDKLGTASCISSFAKQVGEPCKYSNDCADGMLCIDATGTGAVCRYMCLTPYSLPPFDAGTSPEDAGVGKGSCPTPTGCNITGFTNLPAWLSFCRLADGG
ncbi:hypothetical protein AKJ09_07615 [Labilithrix luteola]|uniref:Tryptophan synthase alpha chain n=1 Tax=Labilithrix luteola TaxID=1391654 RepID=A0A0K1Q5M1_9BACT|nr:hypothetical protein AKJ09_07615 [Labilithrix luteola]